MNKQNKPLITYKYSLYLQSFESLMHWVRSVSQFAEGVAQSPTENPLHWNSARNGLIVFFLKIPIFELSLSWCRKWHNHFQNSNYFPFSWEHHHATGGNVGLDLETIGTGVLRLNDYATTAVTNRNGGNGANFRPTHIRPSPSHEMQIESYQGSSLYSVL